MEFEAIILEHMGKDIYIALEEPWEQRRREEVFHNYQVLSPDQEAYRGTGTGILCSRNNHKNYLKLELRTKIEKLSYIFDMIDIEARSFRRPYHIYIMNHISQDCSRLFLKKQEWR